MVESPVGVLDWRRPRWGRHRGGVLRYLALGGLILAAFGACSAEPPPGEVVDFESLPQFKPFELQTVDGERRVLDDYLDRVTLVSFFFPT